MKNYGLDPMGRLVSNVFLVRNANVMSARGTTNFQGVFFVHILVLLLLSFCLKGVATVLKSLCFEGGVS